MPAAPTSVRDALRTLAFLAVLAVAVVLAWRNRFVQDDAFISFQYARSWVEGDGLTWFGERVEGYTNFLWVVWIAVGMLLGYGPVEWATLGGLVAFVVLLLAVMNAAERIVPSFAGRLFVVAALATNHSVSAYATGGLETMWATVMATGVVVLVTRWCSNPTPSLRATIGLSVLCAASFLNRMDSAVVLAAVSPFLVGHLLHRPRGLRWRLAVALAAPAAAIARAWLAWKAWTYGSILPNSYSAKIGGGGGVWVVGARYVVRFLHAYALWPVLVVVAGVWWARRGRRGERLAGLGPTSAAAAAWPVYVAWIGGDFMEFRLLVVAAPLLLLITARLASEIDARSAVRAAVLTATLAVLVLASLRHAATFEGTEDRTIDGVDALATFYGLYPDGDWSRIGDALARELGVSDVTIAVTASGAIPYFSRLDTVDMHGINDAEIARGGRRAGSDWIRPGHRVVARWSRLLARGVNLVVGHPQVVPRGALAHPGSAGLARQVVRAMSFLQETTPRDPTVVAMPIDDDEELLMIYLQPHPAVDERIVSGRWSMRAVR